MKSQSAALLTALTLLTFGSAQTSWGDPVGPSDRCGALDTDCSIGGGGSYVGLSEAQTRALPKDPPNSGGSGGGNGGGGATAAKRTYEYSIPLSCPSNSPISNEVGCIKAYQTCVDVPNATGPYVDIYRRIVTEPTAPGGNPTLGSWERVGSTCWPTLVPNSDAKPKLTLAMITAQWRRTAFARPQVSTQPVGGRTLVELPTYFEMTWPTTGFEPGEVDAVTMLGHRVRIKPTFNSNLFVFGDGTTLSTTSNGGPYPDGDVVHTYDRKADIQVHVVTTYGGEYSVDGSPWAPIPGTVAITGPDSALTVATADNQLVAN